MINLKKISTKYSKLKRLNNKSFKKVGTIEFVMFNKIGFGKTINTNPEPGFMCIVNRTNSDGSCWISKEIMEILEKDKFLTSDGEVYIME